MSDDVPFTTNSPLQIGIEIEFVAPHDKDWEDEYLLDIDPFNHISLSKDACFHRLAEALDAAGLWSCYQMRTTSLNCPRNPLREQAPAGSIVLETYRIMGDASRYKKRDGRAGLFRYWLVKGEYNLTEIEAYKEWIMCELTSPILSECDVFGDFSELGTALATINGALDETPHIFPKRSGLHVHLAPTSGSSFAFAQRVLTLVVMLDQVLLFPLCDTERRHLIRPFLSAATLEPVDKIVPTAPDLDARSLAHLPPSFAEAEGRVLTYIWCWAKGFDDLQYILEHHRADLLTIAPMLCKHKHAGSGGGIATTVEFRHAQASFSRRFVRNWARLVLAIGRVGVLPTGEYRVALERIWAAVVAARSRTEGEDGTLGVLAALSAEAVGARISEGLDLEYWRNRYGEMRNGRNPDIDEEGKVVLDREYTV